MCSFHISFISISTTAELFCLQLQCMACCFSEKSKSKESKDVSAIKSQTIENSDDSDSELGKMRTQLHDVYFVIDKGMWLLTARYTYRGRELVV